MNATRIRFLTRLPRFSAGFSLMEMAIVLMIMGVLLSGVLVSVSQTTENNRRTATKALLNEIEEALYGFAQANGRLPCPAENDNFGFESPLGGGDCVTYHGFVPVATLGLNGAVNGDGLLLDAWQNPFRYSVSNYDSTDGTVSFTDAGEFATLFNSDPGLTLGANAAVDLLILCDTTPATPTTCNAANTIASNIPAVVISMGSNWATFTSADEIANGSGDASMPPYTVTNTNVFVSTQYNDATYDDMLVWISPYVLFSKMVSSGQLP